MSNSKAPPKPPQSSLRGRDSRTGHFIPVEEARRRPATTEVERIPFPGKGNK
jgi:hypothetical protein